MLGIKMFFKIILFYGFIQSYLLDNYNISDQNSIFAWFLPCDDFD